MDMKGSSANERMDGRRRRKKRGRGEKGGREKKEKRIIIIDIMSGMGKQSLHCHEETMAAKQLAMMMHSMDRKNVTSKLSRGRNMP